jgi:tetratricopeptide (TPR) repeat protein
MTGGFYPFTFSKEFFMKRLFFLAVLAMMLCSSTAHIWAQQKTPLMEQIEAALGQSSSLLGEKKYAEALKAANDAVEFLPQPVKENYKSYAVMCYGNLSWILTLNKQCAPAVEAAKKALTFATGDAEWIEGNLAHAYLMSGQTQEAEKIYRKYIGKIFGDGEDTQSWSQIILGDFKIMRKAGIDSPEIAKIEQIFEQEKVKARLENKTKNFTFPISPTAKILLSRVSPNGEYAFLVTYHEEGGKPNLEFLLIDLADGSILTRKKNSDLTMEGYSNLWIKGGSKLTFGEIVFSDVQFTPDSKKIVFLNDNNPTFYDVTNIDKGIDHSQEVNLPIDYFEGGTIYSHKIAFSADGSLIALEKIGTQKGEGKKYLLVKIYDLQQKKILVETSFEVETYPGFNSSLVFSSESKHLYLPVERAKPLRYYPYDKMMKFGNYPVDYVDLEIARLKTGKGEVLEVTVGARLNSVVDMTQNNIVFTCPGLVTRPDMSLDSEIEKNGYRYLLPGISINRDKRSIPVGNLTLREIPEDSLTAKTFSLHGKMNETLTKYQDSSLFFSFRGFPAKESNFLRYLPGGERSLFFIAEEKELQPENRNESMTERLNREIAERNKSDRTIIGLGVFNLAQEIAKTKPKLLELVLCLLRNYH